ncbi:hypothetical protein AB0C96_08965 [Streptomyces sp. NPDC048506]|uniref:hypothetical protein n=1 Tax=Streptomyces sp. NPDC048506 TaxID=3155028 RepID=UPI003430BD84
MNEPQAGRGGGHPRGTARSAPSRSALVVRIVAAVPAVGEAAGAVVDVYRIGDSGAKAAWHDGFSKTATGDRGDRGDND